MMTSCSRYRRSVKARTIIDTPMLRSMLETWMEVFSQAAKLQREAA
jgi:hypothetical protein